MRDLGGNMDRVRTLDRYERLPTKLRCFLTIRGDKPKMDVIFVFNVFRWNYITYECKIYVLNILCFYAQTSKKHQTNELNSINR